MDRLHMSLNQFLANLQLNSPHLSGIRKGFVFETPGLASHWRNIALKHWSLSVSTTCHLLFHQCFFDIKLGVFSGKPSLRLYHGLFFIALVGGYLYILYFVIDPSLSVDISFILNHHDDDDDDDDVFGTDASLLLFKIRGGG